MTTENQIVAEARALIGLPFRHLGRGPYAFDCLGMVLQAFKCAGLMAAEVDFTDYGRNVADYELEQRLDETPHFDRLPSWHDAQQADILLQRFHATLPASHLILITDRQDETLWGVHASRRGVVEQRIAHLDRNRAAYRLCAAEVF